ncbi:MAG TPA: hypothetical protein VGN34_30325 [Ktedonobacteraceae bacterium]|jgi:hypothetical protein
MANEQVIGKFTVANDSGREDTIVVYGPGLELHWHEPPIAQDSEDKTPPNKHRTFPRGAIDFLGGESSPEEVDRWIKTLTKARALLK